MTDENKPKWTVRRCTDCGKIRPYWLFAVRSKSPIRYHTYCKSCAATRMAKWRDAHPGYAAKLTARRRKQKPEKVRREFLRAVQRRYAGLRGMMLYDFEQAWARCKYRHNVGGFRTRFLAHDRQYKKRKRDSLRLLQAATAMEAKQRAKKWAVRITDIQQANARDLQKMYRDLYQGQLVYEPLSEAK